jgi:hypothetical protein
VVTNQNSQFRDLAMEIDKMPALHNEGNTPPLGTTAQKIGENPEFPPDPHGGGGNPDLSINNIVIDNHQTTINHNHCPLDDCDLFTEHRYPDAIGEHIERFFLVDHGARVVKDYGPDVVNKVIAYMKSKLEREPEFVTKEIRSLGGYFHSRCKKYAAGANTPTGKDEQTALQRLKDHRPDKKTADRNKYLVDFELAHRND